MRFLYQLLLIAACSYVLSLFMPWWSIFLASAIGGALIQQRGISAYAAGFLAIGILWFVQAYLVDQANHSILSTRIAALLSLPSSMMLILITAVLGGVCGGLGALTGTLAKKVF